jgi:hypothetical protein
MTQPTTNSLSVAAIRKIYTSNVVVHKIDKEVKEIPQEVGVWQGVNMAPILISLPYDCVCGNSGTRIEK